MSGEFAPFLSYAWDTRCFPCPGWYGLQPSHHPVEQKLSAGDLGGVALSGRSHILLGEGRAPVSQSLHVHGGKMLGGCLSNVKGKLNKL